jgi:hypothetical protein
MSPKVSLAMSKNDILRAEGWQAPAQVGQSSCSPGHTKHCETSFAIAFDNEDLAHRAKITIISVSWHFAPHVAANHLEIFESFFLVINFFCYF